MVHTIGKVQYDTEEHNRGWDDKTYRFDCRATSH
jgi:hypothetical protein